VTARYVGTDTSTGQTVVVAVVDPKLRELQQAAVGSLQRHLAGLLAVVDAPNLEALPTIDDKAPTGVALVAELIRGASLFEHLNGNAMPPDRAVAWTMRMLEGLQVLHQRHAPHGALSSHAVVAEPKARPIAPVVSQLVVPALKSYISPERLSGSGPSIADDLWAVGLLLFEMLTGHLPARQHALPGTPRELPDSETHPIRNMPHGRELEAIVKRCLSPDRLRRPATVDELLDILDHWEQRIGLPPSLAPVLARAPARLPIPTKANQLASWDYVVDTLEGGGRRLIATLDAAEQMRQSVLSDRRNVLHTSEYPSAATPTTLPPKANQRSERPNPDALRRRLPSFGPEMAAFRERSKPKFGIWWVTVIGGFFALAVLAANYGLRDDKDRKLAVSDVKSAETPLVAALPAPAERPRLPVSQERSQCIRSYFRPDTLAPNIDLAFVCTEEDFLAVIRKLNDEAFVATAPAPGSVPSATTGLDAGVEKAAVANNPAMVIRLPGGTNKGWQLGWYELVANAIIRQNCCREAAPIKLPETTGWCQQVQSVVRRIALDSAKVGDISPGVRAFDEAIGCLIAQGRHAAYPYKGAPTSLQRSNFQQFLKHAAEVDARRTSRR
jgi:hypothetical protein